MIVKPVCLIGLPAHLARLSVSLAGGAAGAVIGFFSGAIFAYVGEKYINRGAFEQGVVGITIGFALMVVGFGVLFHWFEGCRCHCGDRFAFCISLVLWRGERIPWIRPHRPYVLKAPQAYTLIPPEECP